MEPPERAAEPSEAEISADEETEEIPEDDPEYDLAIERGKASFHQWAETCFYSRLRFNEIRAIRERYERYRRPIFKAFVTAEGPVLASFFCEHVPAAAAVTEATKERRRWFRRIQTQEPKLHSVVNAPEGADEDADALAALDILAQCEALATSADENLTGEKRKKSIEMVFGVVTDALFLLDRAADQIQADAEAAPPASGPRDRPASKLVEDVRGRLAAATTYVGRAATLAAQFIYFGGMGAALLLLAVVVALPTAFLVERPDRNYVLGALLAGAVGAVASVFSRVKANGLKLDYELGKLHLFVLGGIRPFLGMVSAGLLYFAVRAGVLRLDLGTEAVAFAMFVVVGFFAGFNERWAEDMLGNVSKRLGPAGSQASG
jgi:hypothetical protein